MNRLDAFPKILEGASVRTVSGGVLTLVTVFVMSALLLYEFYHSFIHLDEEFHMTVDPPATYRDTVDLSLHITFPWMGCEELEVHAEHTKGETGYRHREAFSKLLPTEKELQPFRDLLGADFKYPTVVVEKTEGGDRPRPMRGCTIKGVARVAKVSGDLHVWVPKPRVRPMEGLKGLPSVFPGLVTVDATPHNISHVIHEMHFGAQMGFMESALDGAVNIVREGLAQYQYNIKLVPTTVRRPGRLTVRTNQYSVTEDDMVLDVMTATSDRFHPGVYMYYDFSPIAVIYSARPKGLLSFLTSFCAVVGGAVAILRALDVIVHRFFRFKKD